MTVRATMSQDGTPRVDLVIPVRLSREAFVEILAYRINTEQLTEPLGHRMLMREIKEQVRRHGVEHLYYWHEDVEAGEVERARALANEWITKYRLWSE